MESNETQARNMPSGNRVVCEQAGATRSCGADDGQARPDAFEGHRSVATSADAVAAVLETGLRSTGVLDTAVVTTSAQHIEAFAASLAKSIAGISGVCTCGVTGWISEAEVSKNTWDRTLERCLGILGRFALFGHGLGTVSAKRAALEIAEFNAVHSHREQCGGIGIVVWTKAEPVCEWSPFPCDTPGHSFKLSHQIPSGMEWRCCICRHRIEDADASENGVFYCATCDAAHVCAGCRRSPRPPCVSFFTALDALAEFYEYISVFSDVAPQCGEWPPLPPAGLHAPMDDGNGVVWSTRKPRMLINAVVSTPPQREPHLQILRAIGRWQHVAEYFYAENGDTRDPDVTLVWKGCAWQIGFGNDMFEPLAHVLLNYQLSISPPSASSTTADLRTFYSNENSSLPFPGDSSLVLDLICRLAKRASRCKRGARGDIAGGAHPGMCFAVRGGWDELNLRSGGTWGLPDNVHFAPRNLRPDPRHLDLIDADLDALSPDLDLRKVAQDLAADQHTAKTDVYCIALFAAWLWLGPRALSTLLRVAISAAALQPVHWRSDLGSTRLCPLASALFPFLVGRYLRLLRAGEGLNTVAAEAVERGLSSDPAERPSANSLAKVFRKAFDYPYHRQRNQTQYASRRQDPVAWLGLVPPPECGCVVSYRQVVDWLLPPPVRSETGAIVDWIQHCHDDEGALVIVWQVEGPSDVSFFGAVVQRYLLKADLHVQVQQRGFVLRWTSKTNQKVALRFEYAAVRNGKEALERVRAEMVNRRLDAMLKELRLADQSDNDLKAVNPNTKEHGLVTGQAAAATATVTRRRLRWGRAIENYLVHPKEMLSLLRVQVPMPSDAHLQFSAAWAFAMEMELSFAQLYFPVRAAKKQKPPRGTGDRWQAGDGWLEPTSFFRAVANNCERGLGGDTGKTVDVVAAAYDQWKGVPHVEVVVQDWFVHQGAEASSFAASVCAGELTELAATGVTDAQRTACRDLLARVRAALVAVHLPLPGHGTDSLFRCPDGADGQFLPGRCPGTSNESVRPLTALASSSSAASDKELADFFNVLGRFKCLSCGAPASEHKLRAEDNFPGQNSDEQFAVRLSYGFDSHRGWSMLFEGDTFLGEKSHNLNALTNPTAMGQKYNLQQLETVFQSCCEIGQPLVELRKTELSQVVEHLVTIKNKKP